MKLSDLKIGTRLYIGFGAMVAIMTTLVIVAAINFAKLSQANDINIHTYQVMGEIGNALESLINIETGQRGFALTGNPGSLEPYNAGKEEFRKHLDKAKALTSDNPKQQERLQKLLQEQQEWMTNAVNPVIKMRTEATDGKMDSVVALMQEGKGKKGMDAMRVLIAEINNAEGVLLEQRGKDAATLQSMTSSILIGGGIFTAVLAALIAMWLTRNITGPLRQVVDIAKRVALGDLTVKVVVNSKDETGEMLSALKDMNESLVRIVGEVRGGTDTIATASSEIASGNLDLSSRTEQQASSLEETASSMEELTSTVKQNADNARQANQLALSASQVAIKGGSVVSKVVETMGSINESAKKIVDIIGVIDGIAFQTNILALNAAVEAARAGEQGRGFAVVAAEVRSLAQRSAGAAKEIKALIGDSVEKVDIGSKLVDEAGVTMNEVVTSVKHVTDIISEIASASEEQRAGIEQVNQAITQMDEVTQQNAALVEQASAAAEAMQEQAGKLSEVVSVFKLDMSSAPVARSVPNTMTVAHKPATKSRRVVSAPPAQQRAATSIPGAGHGKPRSHATSDQWEEF